ncbi:hypothetical protein [Kallotenue papyrolyticum]|uniref:hypothetical protein n=1 Tax=Kallotenue papyrolyticum TaxID=1325125 RepID=UPI0004922E4C|nr:hypothetical protein [Kallotenue papyrolyticum]
MKRCAPLRPLPGAVLVGVLVAGVALALPVHFFDGAGDVFWALDAAQALATGRDPYAGPAGPEAVPYPLPAALFGLPLLWLPPPLAGAVFVGLCAALLTWCLLRAAPWRLWVLASFPFFCAVYFRQWSPLIMAAWFVPVLAPLLVLVKPQIALPVALQRLTWRGVALAAAVLVLSLLIDPGWPRRWLARVGGYQAVVPALELPFGPVLLLALLRWRDPRARLLALMALLPLRGVYDLCALWLVPRSARQASTLALLSWSIYLLMLVDGPTRDGVVLLVFLPALVLLFWPQPFVADATAKRYVAAGAGELRLTTSPTPGQGQADLSR